MQSGKTSAACDVCGPNALQLRELMVEEPVKLCPVGVKKTDLKLKKTFEIEILSLDTSKTEP